jgi:hypothetical protein
VFLNLHKHNPCRGKGKKEHTRAKVAIKLGDKNFGNHLPSTSYNSGYPKYFLHYVPKILRIIRETLYEIPNPALKKKGIYINLI